jgi:hypothetical protein
MQTSVPNPTRSAFVTAVAWIFIALGGFTTFISIVQNILINTVFPLDRIGAARHSAPDLPPWFDFAFDHIRTLFFIPLIVCSTTLVAAIGLLQRRNWARRLFVGLLAIAVAWNLAGLVLQQLILSSMMTFPQRAAPPPELEATMHGMMIGMRVFSALVAIAFSVLYAWMIRRLTSPAIVAEFAGG